MNRPLVILFTTAALLAGVYVRYFTDWFRPKDIQITPQIRPLLLRSPTPGTVYPVAFGLDRKCELTAIKVVSSRALATNELAVPVWFLTSETGSPPVKAFTYGQPVPGMQPFNPGAPVVALQANEEYRVFVEAGSKKGECRFVAAGPVISTNQAAPVLVPLASPPPPPPAK